MASKHYMLRHLSSFTLGCMINSKTTLVSVRLSLGMVNKFGNTDSRFSNLLFHHV